MDTYKLPDLASNWKSFIMFGTTPSMIVLPQAKPLIEALVEGAYYKYSEDPLLALANMARSITKINEIAAVCADDNGAYRVVSREEGFYLERLTR